MAMNDRQRDQGREYQPGPTIGPCVTDGKHLQRRERKQSKDEALPNRPHQPGMWRRDRSAGTLASRR
jgi:hypothetical protein